MQDLSATVATVGIIPVLVVGALLFWWVVNPGSVKDDIVEAQSDDPQVKGMGYVSLILAALAAFAVLGLIGSVLSTGH